MQVYHPDVELNLNDVVEVIGVYSLRQDISLNFDAMDLEADTQTQPQFEPPPSDIHRKHPFGLVRHCTLHASACMSIASSS